MKKKFTFVIAMLLVVALAMPSSAAVFTDVSTDHWAYEAVNKLVAAGIIEGYPDGTFKGDKGVTRYEVAMMVDRVLERVAEERASLEDEVDAMKDGFTSAQKTELEDIVKSIVEKNMPEPKEETSEDTEGLNEKEYEQIANLIEALTFNYKAELKNLGSDLEDLEGLVDANKEDTEKTIAKLKERVADLEDPVVSFSGSYSVDFTHNALEGDLNYGGSDSALNYYTVEDAPIAYDGYVLNDDGDAVVEDEDIDEDYENGKIDDAELEAYRYELVQAVNSVLTDVRDGTTSLDTIVENYLEPEKDWTLEDNDIDDDGDVDGHINNNDNNDENNLRHLKQRSTS